MKSLPRLELVAVKFLSYGYSVIRLCKSFAELSANEDVLKPFLSNLEHELIMSQASCNLEFNKILAKVVNRL